MKLEVVQDYEALSRRGADILSAWIADKPNSAIVVATGDTPMGVYRQLAQQREERRFDASRLRVFQLDEYLGVPADDNRSLYGWMLRSFIQPLGIDEANVVRLPWEESRAEEGCRAYDRTVAADGGFDIAILGLGPNGHLGFNEPPSPPDAPTRVVELTPQSIESNARYWGAREVVPRKAVTAGMAQLLAARRTLLVASGAHKREILQRSLSGPATPDVPASLLQLAHDVTVLADRAAVPDAGVLG